MARGEVVTESCPLGIVSMPKALCIVGAVVGRQGIPPHWYRRFNDTVRSYLIGHPRFAISDLEKRFAAQAAKVYQA